MGVLQLRSRFSRRKESSGPRPGDSRSCARGSQRIMGRREKSNLGFRYGDAMEGGKEDAGALELWGGIECTHNRVGDACFDQVAWTGHDRRPDDLERFADLGIRTLRYPALWEWAAARVGAGFDW